MSYTKHTQTSCKSKEGISVSLIDGIITMCRILQPSLDSNSEAIYEAYTDLRSDEDVQRIMGISPDQAKWLKIQCDMVVDVLGKKSPSLSEVTPPKPLESTCHCKGEMHDEGCPCTCTDHRSDPHCLKHSKLLESPQEIDWAASDDAHMDAQGGMGRYENNYKPFESPREIEKSDYDVLIEAYPDARIWEHAPEDWQVAAGSGGEIKTYGHKTAAEAVAAVAKRIKAMREPKPAPQAERFEEWWDKYLSNRTISPFPEPWMMVNGRQAALTSWTAAQVSLLQKIAEMEEKLREMQLMDHPKQDIPAQLVPQEWLDRVHPYSVISADNQADIIKELQQLRAYVRR